MHDTEAHKNIPEGEGNQGTSSKKKLKKTKTQPSDLHPAEPEPGITSSHVPDDVTTSEKPGTKSTDQQSPSEAQTTMQEYQVITAAHTKPHALLALLAELKGEKKDWEVRAIVFASAVDTARRLKNLLDGSKNVLELQVHEMSSRVSSRVQVQTLEALQKKTSWCAAQFLSFLLPQVLVRFLIVSGIVVFKFPGTHRPNADGIFGCIFWFMILSMPINFIALFPRATALIYGKLR